MEHREAMRASLTWQKFKRIECKLDRLLEIGEQMAIDQQTFDTDLQALVASIGDLVTAVDALIASKPAADLTAEDQSVQTASQTVADELAKLNPAAPPAQ